MNIDHWEYQNSMVDDIKIEDDCLSEFDLNVLKTNVFPNPDTGYTPPYYVDHIIGKNVFDEVKKETDSITHGMGQLEWKYNFQNVMLMYGEINDHFCTGIASDFYSWVIPIAAKINPKHMLRVKLNLGLCKDTHILTGFHSDLEYDCTTSIFYVNTNNGYTQFKNGAKIESVENRLISFPTHMKHCSVNQTDTPFRSVVNFNYYDRD